MTGSGNGPPLPWGRIALGGIAAGVVLNLSGMISATVLELAPGLQRLGWEPAAWTFAFHLGFRFLAGGLAVFLYAVFRSRYGPGARPVVAAAVVVWLGGYVNLALMLGELGVLEPPGVALGLAWGLGETLVATTLGARLYRDRPLSPGPSTP